MKKLLTIAAIVATVQTKAQTEARTKVQTKAQPETQTEVRTEARATQQPDTAVVVERVNVNGSRSESIVRYFDSPLTVSTIDRTRIEQSSESALLPVLGQHVPGLFVTQRSVTGFGASNGSAGEVNIRGVGQGNKVLMLFDGQPQWAGLFGHHLPDTYVASDIERVEVVRGPASLACGSNAMGGAVNMITRSMERDGCEMNARLIYGSYNTQKYMARGGWRKGRLSTFLSVNHDRTDGHRAGSKEEMLATMSSLFPDVDKTNIRAVSSHFHITNGFGKVACRISDHLDAVANVSLAGFASANPGMVDSPIFDNTVDVVRGSVSAALNNRYDRCGGAAQLFYNFGSHFINDGYQPQYTDSPTPRTTLFHSIDHNYGARLYQWFALFHSNITTAGLDYKNWGGAAWNTGLDRRRVGANMGDNTIDETAFSLVSQQSIVRQLCVSAGVRYEYNSAFGPVWVPSAGITWRPWSSPGTLKFAFSKGFRSPNIRELYMFPPRNPDLKPENMFNYELSAGKSFLDGRLFGEVTAFLIDARNIIVTNMTSSGPKNENVSGFVNRGVEAEVRWRASEKLDLSANYSYLHTGKPIVAAPEQMLFVSATFKPGRFSLNLNAQGIHNLYVYLAPSTPRESYLLFNARAAYDFSRKSNDKLLTLFVKGENLTNARYTINYGYPMPGIVVLAGVDIPIAL
ncbi:MAG: TonB-dependent receptor [Rikenellaceae bacterium]|jgi:iron complex outermembrane receptor protein|nr:TonB-dependent receptor [Rikenellaceae bacterium]